MVLKCLRDCYGTPQTGLFRRDELYIVDLSKPWVIHFTNLPEAPPEDVQALAEAKRNEVARGKRELERRRIAKKKSEEAEDGFADMSLSVPE